MKKIYCVTDFSSISDNAIQYAAQIAKDTDAKLVLLGIQNEVYKDKVPVFEGHYDSGQSLCISKLAESCDLLRGIWGIRCDYKEIGDALDQADEELDVQLIILGIGTLGKDTPYKLYTRINKKIVPQLGVPILLAPQEYRHKKINRILYVFDYLQEKKPPLIQLEKLAGWLKAEVRVLEVVMNRFSSKEESKIESFNAELQSKWKGDYTLSFDIINYPDIANGLEHYIKLLRADSILVFSIGKPSFTDILFHKGLEQQLILSFECPILFIH